MPGNEYYENLSHLNEEAIYLTSDSKVEVAKDGVKNTGIENSVRVGFAQIARVKATESTQATITGMTCATALWYSPLLNWSNWKLLIASASQTRSVFTMLVLLFHFPALHFQ